MAPVLSPSPASSSCRCPGPRARGLPCAPAPGGELSATVHPPPPLPAVARLAGAEGQRGVTAPCCQRELPQRARTAPSRAPRSRGRPAAPLCAAPGPRAAPLRIPPRPAHSRARSHLSRAPHVVSAVRDVPLQRRSGRGRQTLTKRARGRRGGGGGLRPRRGLVWDRPCLCGSFLRFQDILGPPVITTGPPVRAEMERWCPQ